MRLYTYIHAFKINIMHDDKTILLSSEMKKKAKWVTYKMNHHKLYYLPQMEQWPVSHI